MVIQSGLIMRYTCDKLRDKTTYIVTLIVGSFINCYGQFIVPMVRGDDFSQALSGFGQHFSKEPVIVGITMLLGFMFPFCVGILTAVITRYANRETESMAIFPNHKPDPVFRADKDGHIIAMGKSTSHLFDAYGFTSAESIIGEQTWKEIMANHHPEIMKTGYLADTIQIGKDMTRFLVAYVVMPEQVVNIYMTRLP